MKLTFRLPFYTHYGQALFLSGNHEMLGNGDLGRAIPLRYVSDKFWEVSLELPPSSVLDTTIHYNYILRNSDGSFIYDWDRDRSLNLASFHCDELLITDSWNSAAFYENVFYTEPFKKVLLKPNRREFRAAAPEIFTHTFSVKAPLLEKNQTLCLLGNSQSLGYWSTAEPVLLNRTPGDGFLSVQLDLSRASLPILYTYGVYDLKKEAFVTFEDGENRSLEDMVVGSRETFQPQPSPPMEEKEPAVQNKQTIINDGFARLPSTVWKGAGVAIPVFSLRSEKSFGIGEFTDLKLLADWAAQVGLKLIQLLPINDTTANYSWADCYPYAAISAFALHPIYLNLAQATRGENLGLLEKFEPERKRLNSLDALDYEAVIKAKLEFLKEIYPLQKEETFSNHDYQAFFAQNKHWLEPYAAFCYLRDKYETTDWKRWPAHREYNDQEVARLANPRKIEKELVGAGVKKMDISSPSPPLEERVGERRFSISEPAREFFDSTTIEPEREATSPPEIGFHYFVQYHLHLQLKQATEYAHGKGVVLKGDLPIGVSRAGADTWQNPELYRLDKQAGAPPDAFATKGQNWGFPTYNWQRMKEDGFRWWKQRFEQMSYYFDAFRMDHILGFFRIWSIPSHAVEGIMGYFVPAIPVNADEFLRRGIWFDRDRYTRPHITDQILRQLFGTEAELVKSGFLNTEGLNNYSLKPEFATQRQIEAYFADLDFNDYNHTIKQGLFDLISNVLLFEVPESQGTQFHFRFAIESTTSFRDLAPHIQAQLKELYIDYFFRRQDDFWRNQAMEKLPALKRATNMLVCGEDLGLVPACVPEVMKDLGLLSLEVQRMPKDLGREFSRPKEAPYLSVVTPSTHDMSTIRGWWEEDPARTQRFFNQELGEPGIAPPTCDPWINKAIIAQHLASPAIWSIFQLQDLLGMDEQLRRKNPQEERINVPANPNNQWRYRLHLSLEKLLQSHSFNAELRDSIRESGR